LCTCSHTKGWHGNRATVATRCTATACVCPAFAEARALKGNKYGAKQTTIPEAGNTKFDSKAEANWARELLQREAAGQIVGLRFHPKYPMQIGDVLVTTYEPDADWTDCATGEICVADLKGVETAAFKIKRRLLQACYGITLQTIPARDYATRRPATPRRGIGR
jgi:hypothetical protein